ncbi:MAG: SurA N-terminal domain-containing protein [Devosia sp.]
MLDLLRRFTSTLGGKILGVLLLIGLAGFGISNVILDLGSNTLARVGDEDISVNDFKREYQRELDVVQQQTGQVPTSAQALQMGIPTSVISQLSSNAAINQLGLRYGIGISDAKLAELVRNDRSFNGALGTFDRDTFLQSLGQNGLTEAQYFDLQTRAARRQQIAVGLFAGMPPAKTAEDLLNRYRYDTRTVEYFTLNTTSIPDIGTPTDDDLKAYLTAHQTDFRTLETRTADVVYLSPAILAEAPAYQPAEDAVQAEYDKTKAQLVKIEKRHILQVVLATPELEKTFQDQLAAGANFTAAAATANVTPTDIGILTKADVSDPALADAAFGLAKAGDFIIISGIGNKRAVGVTEIEGGGQISYEDAKPDIVKRLAIAKAKNDYADLQDQIEELRAAFKPLKDIATRFKLPIETVSLTSAGSELAAVPSLAETDRPKIAKAIFAATAGKLAPTASLGASNNVWFDLTKVEPARDQTLDEVRDAVTTAWVNAKTDDALQAEVKKITAELDGGKSFQDVATELNQFATVSQPISRDGDGTKVLSQQVATSIFSTGPDSHGWAVDGDGEYVVYHVTDVTLPTAPAPTQVVDYLTNGGRDALYAQFINGVRDEAGIKINQQALMQTLGLDQTP